MSTSRYLQIASAGAAGGSTVPTGPVIGLECVCTWNCLLNCSCCMCINDMHGYAYGDKQWLSVATTWFGGACYGGIGIMHYDDESCWVHRTWNTCNPSGFGDGLNDAGAYVHPISGTVFSLGKAGANSGILYNSSGVDGSTSPGSWSLTSTLGTTSAGGISAVSAVADCAIHQSSFYNGGNLLTGGCRPFGGNYVPGVMGGYCDANCCFFYAQGQMYYLMQIPRQCNGANEPLCCDAPLFSTTAASASYCCYRARGKSMQYFVDEDGVVHATGLVCKCNGCYVVKSCNGMYSWGVFLSFCTAIISNIAYTGHQYIYSCNSILMAGSCCLCWPGTSTVVCTNSDLVKATVLRDRVYISICQTLYRGIQG